MEFYGKRLVHTPEGVRDIYGAEFANKLHIQHLFHDKLHSFGYQDIQTPTFEFFDVFGKEVGTTPSKELYKFFDKAGNTLVLRPDFTPSIARSAAKYFMDETTPIRFCYEGNTYTNKDELQGKLKETTQMGAELIGDGSAEADAEMIALLIQSLLNVGLTKFQVSIGQVEYFNGLCASSGIDCDTQQELKKYISNRNSFSAKELLLGSNINKESMDSLLLVSELFGGYEVLDRAYSAANNDRSRAAIDRLKAVYELLKLYGVEQYVAFDLGLVNKYNYYTGVVFRAYTYQAGSAIAKGGRYDRLLSQFGKDAPAIGFMVLIDDLMAAMSRQNILDNPEKKSILLVYKDDYANALSTATKYRTEGYAVTLMKCSKEASEYQDFAHKNNISEVKFV